jgi:steroid delta-isomerase-like uncharacterized protein
VALARPHGPEGLPTKEAKMKRFAPVLVLLLLLCPVAAAAQAPAPSADPAAYARSAAPPEISAAATVLDADGTVLHAGTNGWTCVAMPGQPMCVDRQWMNWLDAYMHQRNDVRVDAVGIAYMLQGDVGASNTDPFAAGPTADNEWVVTGPHLMIVVPDAALLEGMPTDPRQGGPYVMWRNTPFVHVMIPVEAHSVRMHGDGPSPVERHQRAIAAFNAQDAATVAELYAPDAVLHDPQAPEPVRGRAAVRDAYAGLFRAFPDINVAVENRRIVDNRMIYEIRLTGTNTGPMATPAGDVPATGRAIDVVGAVFADLDDAGRFRTVRRYYDVAGMMRQLGLD